VPIKALRLTFAWRRIARRLEISFRQGEQHSQGVFRHRYGIAAGLMTTSTPAAVHASTSTGS